MTAIRTDRLTALLHLASKETTRPGICGVHFDPRGFAVATDGRVMGAMKIEAFEGAPFTIPRATVELAVKAAGKYGTSLVSRSLIGNISFTSEEAAFPQKWQQLCATSLNADSEPAVFAPGILMQVEKALRALGSKSVIEVIGKGNNAGIVAHSNEDTFLIIAMPMRGRDAKANARTIASGKLLLGI